MLATAVSRKLLARSSAVEREFRSFGDSGERSDGIGHGIGRRTSVGSVKPGALVRFLVPARRAVVKKIPMRPGPRGCGGAQRE